MDFSKVMDISIPEGNVTKITEATSPYRVLWQKGLPVPKAHWEIIELPNADTNGELYYPLLTFVDTGDGIEFFKRTGGQHFKYMADGTAETIYTFQDTPSIQCADIDPVSKKWIAFGSDYVSNAFDDTKVLDRTKNLCCWSPKLGCFCAISSRDAVVVNLDGEIQGTSQGLSFGSTTVDRRSEALIWSDSLSKFVIPELTSSYYVNSICFSSDGLSWDTKAMKLTGDFPNFPAGDETRISMYKIRWIPIIEKFVSVCRANVYDSSGTFIKYNEYIIKSSDCQNWECVREYFSLGSSVETHIAYSPDKKVLLLRSSSYSYITRDLENWVEVPLLDGMHQGTAGRILKWSKSLNGFISIGAENAPRFYRLVIEN